MQYTKRTTIRYVSRPCPFRLVSYLCHRSYPLVGQVDPSGTGLVQALDAARFLKKSKLSDVILSKIWDLSDPSGKGYLDKVNFFRSHPFSRFFFQFRFRLQQGGLFVALKLVALAQSGKEIAMSNINSETPPPKLVSWNFFSFFFLSRNYMLKRILITKTRNCFQGELPKVPPTVPPPPASDWSVKPAERDKYNQLFESLQPVNGLIPGNKVIDKIPF